MPRKKAVPKVDFEKSLSKLEGPLLKNSNQATSPWKNPLKLFEEGIQLTRGCQQALQQAEEKITILTQQNQDWLPERRGVSRRFS